MPWSTTRKAGTDPKYRRAEHRNLRAHYVRRIKAGEQLDCKAKVCVIGGPITNPNGNQHDGLHLGHNDDGVTYNGPEHRQCNLHDAARRARAKQETPARWVL